ncbi:MAG TPA: G5 domain-containing protein [Symbiobacteriaceae bacterium]|nr:G5 domain-containing protein [Symbiobacteriaceae bacterium]
MALVVFGGAIAWALVPETHTLSVNGLGNSFTFKTTEQELGAALKTHGIQLHEKDLVTPALATSLAGKKTLTVDVKKATPVTVTVEGKTLEVLTQAKTVAELLQELSIALQGKDSVTPEPTAEIASGLALKVVRRTEKTEVVQEEIPFEVEREADRRMMMGETKEIQAGAPGLKEIRKVTYYEDGQEVGAEIIGEEIISEPVTQIVAFGTGGVVSRGGRDYRYTQELDMSATGYTAGKESNPDGNGYTYTGMRAVRGVVAVDPRVIPLYTRVYVEGYGPAIAADIGGAIKGYKIDLCFDDLSEALNWGRRPVKVYILADD